MNLYIHEKNLHKCIKTQSLKMFMKKGIIRTNAHFIFKNAKTKHKVLLRLHL